jgi:hypothetical protein
MEVKSSLMPYNSGWLFQQCSCEPLPLLAPFSESTVLFLVSLLSPHYLLFLPFPPTHVNTTTTDDINMPKSSSVMQTPLLMLAGSGLLSHSVLMIGSPPRGCWRRPSQVLLWQPFIGGFLLPLVVSSLYCPVPWRSCIPFSPTSSITQSIQLKGETANWNNVPRRLLQ